MGKPASSSAFLPISGDANNSWRGPKCVAILDSGICLFLKTASLTLAQSINASSHAAKFFAALCIATYLLSASGCATVMSEPGKTISQELTINTDPPEARCTLLRYGSSIGTIESTPGSIRIGRSLANVHVTCKKDGYLDAEDTVHSHLRGAFYGNLLWLLGAGYAMVWDLSTGAAWKYDPNLNMRLISSEFSSEAERKEYFESLRGDIRAAFQKTSDEIATKCRPDECDKQMKALKDQETDTLEKVEQQRKITRVKRTGGA